MLRDTEAVADEVWQQVVQWNEFASKLVGEQLAHAADSVGASGAGSLGRYPYGEKLRFLYHARGGLFEAKYWLNRARARSLMASGEMAKHASQLTNVARQLNALARNLKIQRHGRRSAKTVYGAPTTSVTTAPPPQLFSDADFEWLESISHF